MRAVALGDTAVRERITTGFIPLRVTILPGTKEFPLDWPGLGIQRRDYRNLGGDKNEGYTGCAVVSPDLQMQLANTGSAFVWEMFDSDAYDPKRFLAMLDRGLSRHAREVAIGNDLNRTEAQRGRALRQQRETVRRQVAREGAFRWPPRGFSLEGALELFRLSGDLK